MGPRPRREVRDADDEDCVSGGSRGDGTVPALTVWGDGTVPALTVRDNDYREPNNQKPNNPESISGEDPAVPSVVVADDPLGDGHVVDGRVLLGASEHEPLPKHVGEVDDGSGDQERVSGKPRPEQPLNGLALIEREAPSRRVAFGERDVELEEPNREHGDEHHQCEPHVPEPEGRAKP